MTERERAGERLESFSEGLEKATDLVLKNVRGDADKSRLERHADENQKSGNFLKFDSEAGDSNHKAEDDAIVIERSAFDTALDNERNGKLDALTIGIGTVHFEDLS